MATVLVVDDNPMDRHLAGGLAEKAGLRVQYAADGKEALAIVALGHVDLVLTDLLMPEMDGLELVNEIRERHRLVPVILMTAFGSEEIAIAALRKGAASYVPKRNLAHDLAETLEQVLSIVKSGRDQQRLLECLTQTESHFLLDNDPSLIPPLIGHLQENLARMKLCDEIGRIRVSVALQEALVNAIHHGNLEVSSRLREQDEQSYYNLVENRRKEKPFRMRRVHIVAKESPAEAAYVVRDEGPGFDPNTLPDPTDPCNLERCYGRGLLLIRTFMDEVYHNETGNQITLIKRRDREAKETVGSSNGKGSQHV
jgi:CheY-like chemotaxis protein/anti-sigma regulatory factor (Ser/Thr protein kinase)